MALWAVVPQHYKNYDAPRQTRNGTHVLKPYCLSCHRVVDSIPMSHSSWSPPPRAASPSRAVHPSLCCHGRGGCRPGWCDGPPCRVQRDGGAGKINTSLEAVCKRGKKKGGGYSVFSRIRSSRPNVTRITTAATSNACTVRVWHSLQ